MFTLSAQPSYRFSSITVDDGLSYGMVNHIIRDSRGLIWIAMDAGLHLYDGNSIKRITHDPNDTSSLISSNVDHLFEGQKGEIWVNTDAGLNVYDISTGLNSRDPEKWLARYGLPAMPTHIATNSQRSVFLVNGSGIVDYQSDRDSSVSYSLAELGLKGADLELAYTSLTKDRYWMVTRDGILFGWDTRSWELVSMSDRLSRYSADNGFKLFIDDDGDIWVFANHGDDGVFFYDISNSEWEHYHLESKELKLNTNLVRDVTQDASGLIWVGTDHGGINIIDKYHRTVAYILHDPDEANSILHNSVMTLHCDQDGIVWMGTYKNGLNYYHEDLIRFEHHRYIANKPNSLPFNDVNSFLEVSEGLWIGTNGRGLIFYDEANQRYRTYRNDPEDPLSLGSDVVVSLFEDSQGAFWIGTY